MRQILTFMSALAASAVLAGGLSSSALAAPQVADLLIRAANVIDVKTGQVTPGQTVVVRGDDIVAVSADAEAAQTYAAARTYDAAGR